MFSKIFFFLYFSLYIEKFTIQFSKEKWYKLTRVFQFNINLQLTCLQKNINLIKMSRLFTPLYNISITYTFISILHNMVIQFCCSIFLANVSNKERQKGKVFALISHNSNIATKNHYNSSLELIESKKKCLRILIWKSCK